jgi:hypothetical protein
MFCNSCGVHNPDDAEVCSKCGQEPATPRQSDRQAQSAIRRPDKDRSRLLRGGSHKPSRGRGVIWLVAGVAAALIAMTVISINRGDGQPDMNIGAGQLAVSTTVNTAPSEPPSEKPPEHRMEWKYENLHNGWRKRALYANGLRTGGIIFESPSVDTPKGKYTLQIGCKEDDKGASNEMVFVRPETAEKLEDRLFEVDIDIDRSRNDSFADHWKWKSDWGTSGDVLVLPGSPSTIPVVDIILFNFVGSKTADFYISPDRVSVEVPTLQSQDFAGVCSLKGGMAVLR